LSATSQCTAYSEATARVQHLDEKVLERISQDPREETIWQLTISITFSQQENLAAEADGVPLRIQDCIAYYYDSFKTSENGKDMIRAQKNRK
jgi:hypothetical protein